MRMEPELRLSYCESSPVVDLDFPFRGETWQNLSLYLPLEATTLTFWISRRLIPCLGAWSHPNIQAAGWRTPGFQPIPVGLHQESFPRLSQLLQELEHERFPGKKGSHLNLKGRFRLGNVGFLW